MGRRKPKRTSEDNDVKIEAKKTWHDEDKSSKDTEESDDSEESEEIVRENPHVFVWAPDGVSKYTIRKYTNNMQQTNIPYSCTVTSRNGRLFGEDKVMDFWRKSVAACPTYGGCYWCFGGGPTNMHCQVCRDKDPTYKILMTAGQVMNNAEWVAKFFEMTFLFAMADRTHNGLIAEEQVVAMEDIKIFVHERWHGRNEDAMYRIGRWDLFQEGLTWNCHSQCLRTRSKINKWRY
jgi:hypothetical protein